MKIRVAIPCFYYTDIELDVDEELKEELKNDIVEGLENDEKYGDEIMRQLRPKIDFIDSLEDFDSSTDYGILYWKP